MVICSFSFKQSRHHFVLTLHGCYCPNIFHTKTGSYFEALIFQSSFNSCVSFFYFLWLKDFLWFKYRVLKHFSCKGQSVFLIKLHVLLWLFSVVWVDGWFNVRQATVTNFYIVSVKNFVEFVVSRKMFIY